MAGKREEEDVYFHVFIMFGIRRMDAEKTASLRLFCHTHVVSSHEPKRLKGKTTDEWLQKGMQY